MYIYINSTLVSTIHITYKKYLKNICGGRNHTEMFVLPDYYRNLYILI